MDLAAYTWDCLCIHHTQKRKKFFGMPSVAISHIVCRVILSYFLFWAMVPIIRQPAIEIYRNYYLKCL